MQQTDIQDCQPSDYQTSTISQQLTDQNKIDEFSHNHEKIKEQNFQVDMGNQQQTSTKNTHQILSNNEKLILQEISPQKPNNNGQVDNKFQNSKFSTEQSQMQVSGQPLLKNVLHSYVNDSPMKQNNKGKNVQQQQLALINNSAPLPLDNTDDHENSQQSIHQANNSITQSPGKRDKQIKHDQRRQNLRHRRRSREQLMQVVEKFINEATIFTVYQSYVEANFINDMMNTRDSIVNNAVQHGLMVVIREVMSEIIVANEVSQILQSVIKSQTKNICKSVLESQQEQIQNNPTQNQESFIENNVDLQSQQSSDQDLQDYLDSEIIIKNGDELIDDNEQIAEEQVEQDCLQAREEIIQFLYDEVLDFTLKNQLKSISQQILSDIQLELNLKQNDQANYLYEKLEFSLMQEMINDQVQIITVQQHEKQMKIVHKLDNISEILIDKPLITKLLEEFIDEQLIHDSISEYMLQNILQEQLQEITQQEIQKSQIDLDQLLQDASQQLTEIMLNDIIQIESKQLAIVELENSEINIKTAQEEIQASIIDEINQQEILEIVIKEVELENDSELICQQFINGQTKNLVSHTVDEEFEINQAYDKLFSHFLSNLIDESLSNQVAQQKDEQEKICMDLQSEFIENIVKNETLVLAEQQLEIYSQAYSYANLEQNLITSLFNEALEEKILVDCLYEDILKSLIVKDLNFLLQLEKDSQLLCDNLFSQTFQEFSEGQILQEFVPANIQQELLEQQIQSQSISVGQELIIVENASEDIMTEMAYQMLLEILVETKSEQQTAAQQLLQKEQELKITQEREEFSKATILCHQHLINNYLKKWLRQIADDLVLKLITESIYKRIMSKIIKRSVYSIIQTSVESYQTLEDTTLYLAEKVLDGYIQKQLDNVICEEIVLTQDSLIVQDDFVTIYLKQYLLSEIVIECVQSEITSKQQMKQEYQRQLKQNHGRNENVNHNKRQSQTEKSSFVRRQHTADENQNLSKIIRASDLIKTDEDSYYKPQNPFFQQNQNPQNKNDSMISSSDPDNFSDQDERHSNINSHQQQSDLHHKCLEDDDHAILSPSKRPDFHRNILSNSKSVSSSLQLNNSRQMPRQSDMSSKHKNYPNFFDQTINSQQQQNLHTGGQQEYNDTQSKIILTTHIDTSKLSATLNSYHSRSGSSDMEQKALQFAKLNNFHQLNYERKNSFNGSVGNLSSTHTYNQISSFIKNGHNKLINQINNEIIKDSKINYHKMVLNTDEEPTQEVQTLIMTSQQVADQIRNYANSNKKQEKQLPLKKIIAKHERNQSGALEEESYSPTIRIPPQMKQYQQPMIRQSQELIQKSLKQHQNSLGRISSLKEKIYKFDKEIDQNVIINQKHKRILNQIPRLEVGNSGINDDLIQVKNSFNDRYSSVSSFQQECHNIQERHPNIKISQDVSNGSVENSSHDESTFKSAQNSFSKLQPGHKSQNSLIFQPHMNQQQQHTNYHLQHHNHQNHHHINQNHHIYNQLANHPATINKQVYNQLLSQNQKETVNFTNKSKIYLEKQQKQVNNIEKLKNNINHNDDLDKQCTVESDIDESDMMINQLTEENNLLIVNQNDVQTDNTNKHGDAEQYNSNLCYGSGSHLNNEDQQQQDQVNKKGNQSSKNSKTDGGLCSRQLAKNRSNLNMPLQQQHHYSDIANKPKSEAKTNNQLQKQLSCKRVADVLAQQPKEGFKFIEQKVQKQQSLQSLLSQNNLMSADQQKNLHHPYYNLGGKNIIAQFPIKTIQVELQSSNDEDSGTNNTSNFNTKESFIDYTSNIQETTRNEIGSNNREVKHPFIKQQQQIMPNQQNLSVKHQINRKNLNAQFDSVVSVDNYGKEYQVYNTRESEMTQQKAVCQQNSQISNTNSTAHFVDKYLRNNQSEMSGVSSNKIQQNLGVGVESQKNFNLPKQLQTGNNTAQTPIVFRKIQNQEQSSSSQSSLKLQNLDQISNSTTQSQNYSHTTQQQMPGDRLHQEQNINIQLEKLLISLKVKFQEIKKSNCKSSQLASIDLLIRMAQQIVECSRDIDLLFDIDQQLKDSLLKLSSQQRHQQESFSTILLTNQLALLNYQKLSCLVEKKQAQRTSVLSTQVAQISTPKSIHSASLKQQQTQQRHGSQTDLKQVYNMNPFSQQKINQASGSQTQLNKLNSKERFKNAEVFSGQKPKLQDHVQLLANNPRYALSDQQQNQSDIRDYSKGQRVKGFTQYNNSSNNQSKELMNNSSGKLMSGSNTGSSKTSNNMNVKMTSNYFSNNSTEAIRPASNIKTNQANHESLDLKILKQKDLLFIGKFIGKIDSNGCLLVQYLSQKQSEGSKMNFTGGNNSSNNQNLTCQDYQKCQFYLMTLSQIHKFSQQYSNKYSKLQTLSIEEMFNKVKQDKIHQKDWKEVISKQVKKYLE
eukprot:403366433